MNSGAHDLLSKHADALEAPLRAYRSRLAALAAVVERVARANPTMHFVWKTLTHEVLVTDEPPAASIGAGAGGANHTARSPDGDGSGRSQSHPRCSRVPVRSSALL